MFREKVDVVGDNHQVSCPVGSIHAPCGIGDNELPYTGFVQYSYRESDFLHGIPFVEMETPLHGDDVFTVEPSDEQVAFVSFNGGHGEMRYLGVGDDVPHLDGSPQFSQTCSQDNAEGISLPVQKRAEVLCAISDFF